LIIRDLKTELLYGAGLGLALCIWTTALYITGLATTRIGVGQYGESVSLVIPVILILLAVRSRAASRKRPLTLLDRVSTGVLTSLTGQAIYTPFLLIYRRFINPDWLEFILQLRRRGLISSQVPFDQLEPQITQMRISALSLEHTVSALMLNVVVVGSVIGFLSLLVVRHAKDRTIQ
jgi:hypothetical protein